jgi:hypothetical protein
MNTIRMPGLTAETSVYSANRDFQSALSAVRGAPVAEIRPQRIICSHENDVWTCVDTTCRLHCYQTKKGAALRACLEDC